MKFFKNCLKCNRYVFKQYDEIKYKALDGNNQEQIYTSYICIPCSNEVHGEEKDFIENLNYIEEEDHESL